MKDVVIWFLLNVGSVMLAACVVAYLDGSTVSEKFIPCAVFFLLVCMSVTQADLTDGWGEKPRKRG